VASVKRRDDRGGVWLARYRDQDGKEHRKQFVRKIDAERWVTQQQASVDNGMHINPQAGKETIQEYAERWRKAQVHRPTTQALVDSRLRLHVYPQLGSRPLASIRRSEVQAWVRGRADVLEPRTVRAVYRLLATLMRSAVEDRLIAASPCVRIALPRVEDGKVEPLTIEQVEAVAGSVAGRYRALVLMMAGTGLRPGEAFAVTSDRIDFLRRRLRVDRQVVMLKAPEFAPPKTSSSVRTVPLPQTVVDILAAHIATYPLGVDGTLFPAPQGGLIRRNRFNESVWRPACNAAGVDARLHDLRHFYASLLIRHGESVKTVQERLGHASAVETLNTYSHLWPDSEDRTREAVDLVLGAAAPQLRPTGEA
jgi:integrase